MIRCLFLFSILMFFSCKKINQEPTAKKSASAVAGSCIQKDSSNGSTLCIERSVPSSFDAALCNATQGSWYENACNQTVYVKSCKQETIETIDNEPAHSVIYTYYYKVDSSFSCFGSEASAPVASESSNSSSTGQVSVPSSTEKGAALYAERTCVGCHGALDSSKIRGYSAETIIRAFDEPQHVNVKPWPNAEEAISIRDALALKQPQLLELGSQTYKASCESCHKTLPLTTIKDRSFSGIAGARTLAVHGSVTWPNERDARALEAALK